MSQDRELATMAVDVNGAIESQIGSVVGVGDVRYYSRPYPHHQFTIADENGDIYTVEVRRGES